MIVGNFRDLRVFDGSYRGRCIVDLIVVVIEVQYRKVFIIHPGFDDYLVPLYVTGYQYLLPVPQAKLVGSLVAQELAFEALVIELPASSLYMVVGYAIKDM